MLVKAVIAIQPSIRVFYCSLPIVLCHLTEYPVALTSATMQQEMSMNLSAKKYNQRMIFVKMNNSSN